jgi:uncharacterized protein YqgC (DUF456 family)
MEPLLVLILMPVLIGVMAELIFRDTTRASLAAALGCLLAVFLCLDYLEPDGRLSWLATLLVSPFAIAFSLVAVLFCYGRAQARKRNRNHGG